MEENLQVTGFIASLRARFPVSAAKADALHRQKGLESSDQAHCLWLQDLANVTNRLMDENEIEQVQSLIQFFSVAYEKSSSEIRCLIDVGYIENLFWMTSEKGCVLGWKLLPNNLKELYVGFHRRPPIQV